MISREGYRRGEKDDPYKIIKGSGYGTNISMLENDGSPLEKGPLLLQDNLGNTDIGIPGMQNINFAGDLVKETPINSRKAYDDLLKMLTQQNEKRKKINAYGFFQGPRGNEPNIVGGAGIKFPGGFGIQGVGVLPTNNDPVFKGVGEAGINFDIGNLNLGANVGFPFLNDYNTGERLPFKPQPKLTARLKFPTGGSVYDKFKYWNKKGNSDEQSWWKAYNLAQEGVEIKTDSTTTQMKDVRMQKMIAAAQRRLAEKNKVVEPVVNKPVVNKPVVKPVVNKPVVKPVVNEPVIIPPPVETTTNIEETEKYPWLNKQFDFEYKWDNIRPDADLELMPYGDNTRLFVEGVGMLGEHSPKVDPHNTLPNNSQRIENNYVAIENVDKQIQELTYISTNPNLGESAQQAKNEIAELNKIRKIYINQINAAKKNEAGMFDSWVSESWTPAISKGLQKYGIIDQYSPTIMNQPKFETYQERAEKERIQAEKDYEELITTNSHDEINPSTNQWHRWQYRTSASNEDPLTVKIYGTRNEREGQNLNIKAKGSIMHFLDQSPLTGFMDDETKVFYKNSKANDYFGYLKANEDGTHHVLYKKKKDIPEDELYKNTFLVRQNDFDDINFSGRANDSNFSGHTYWTLKSTGKNAIPISAGRDHNTYDYSSGQSVVFIFPYKGKTRYIHFAGSPNSIHKEGDKINKKYKLKKNVLKLGLADAGSYSSSVKGNITNDLLNSKDYGYYNRKGTTGAGMALIKKLGGELPKAQEGGSLPKFQGTGQSEVKPYQSRDEKGYRVHSIFQPNYVPYQAEKDIIKRDKKEYEDLVIEDEAAYNAAILEWEKIELARRKDAQLWDDYNEAKEGWVSGQNHMFLTLADFNKWKDKNLPDTKYTPEELFGYKYKQHGLTKEDKLEKIARLRNGSIYGTPYLNMDEYIPTNKPSHWNNLVKPNEKRKYKYRVADTPWGDDVEKGNEYRRLVNQYYPELAKEWGIDPVGKPNNAHLKSAYYELGDLAPVETSETYTPDQQNYEIPTVEESVPASDSIIKNIKYHQTYDDSIGTLRNIQYVELYDQDTGSVVGLQDLQGNTISRPDDIIKKKYGGDLPKAQFWNSIRNAPKVIKQYGDDALKFVDDAGKYIVGGLKGKPTNLEMPIAKPTNRLGQAEQLNFYRDNAARLNAEKLNYTPKSDLLQSIKANVSETSPYFHDGTFKAKGLSYNYPETIKGLAQKYEAMPVLNEAGFPVYFHGTRSGTLPGMVGSQGLIPYGDLIRSGKAPMTGEISGAMYGTNSINDSYLSATSYNNLKDAIGYAGTFGNTKPLDIVGNYTKFMKGKKNFASEFGDDVANRYEDYYTKQLENYQGLSSLEQSLVKENFPTLLGFNPNKITPLGDKRFIIPSNTSIPTEIGIKGKIGWDETAGMFVPKNKVGLTQDYIGSGTKVLSLDDLVKGGIKNNEFGWSTQLSDYKWKHGGGLPKAQAGLGNTIRKGVKYVDDFLGSTDDILKNLSRPQLKALNQLKMINPKNTENMQVIKNLQANIGVGNEARYTDELLNFARQNPEVNIMFNPGRSGLASKFSNQKNVTNILDSKVDDTSNYLSEYGKNLRDYGEFGAVLQGVPSNSKKYAGLDYIINRGGMFDVDPIVNIGKHRGRHEMANQHNFLFSRTQNQPSLIASGDQMFIGTESPSNILGRTFSRRFNADVPIPGMNVPKKQVKLANKLNTAFNVQQPTQGTFMKLPVKDWNQHPGYTLHDYHTIPLTIGAGVIGGGIWAAGEDKGWWDNEEEAKARAERERSLRYWNY